MDDCPDYFDERIACPIFQIPLGLTLWRKLVGLEMFSINFCYSYSFFVLQKCPERKSSSSVLSTFYRLAYR